MVIELVEVSPAVNDGAFVIIEIHYRVLETNDRRNLVVPFYEIGEEPAP